MNISSRRLFLKKTGVFATAAVIGSVSFAAKSMQKPNIILILSDDQAWDGLSVEMIPGMAESKSDFYQTPNLERLASMGARFSAAYAPAPMCSPTRASIQMGRTPAKNHITKVITLREGAGGRGERVVSTKFIEPKILSALPEDGPTIGETLKAAGYATAHFGKWHLGTSEPGKRGYGEHDGQTGNADGNVQDPNPKDIFGITERGFSFMEKNVKSGQPFYLQLSHFAVHGPQSGLQETVAKYQSLEPGKKHSNPVFAACTEDLDTGVGMIMEKVKSLGIASNTYIIYMSDNGAGPSTTANSLLAHGKGTLSEGGIRSPLIVAGPGIKANITCNQRVAGFDLYPTFCQWAGVKVPAGVEGGSFAGVVQNKGKGKIERPKEGMVFHYPHYGRNAAARPQSAIYLGDYKLLHVYETEVTSLFKITDDIGEQKDLSKEMPEKATAMKRMLFKYLEDVGAPMLAKNPNYGQEPIAQEEPAGERGQANASAQESRTNLRQQRQEELETLEKAYEENDREVMGEVIASMKERMETTAGRATTGQGAAGQNRGAGNLEERQKELQELGKAYDENDRSKMKELIAAIKERMENGPGGRGAGARGGRAGRGSLGAGGPGGG